MILKVWQNKFDFVVRIRNKYYEMDELANLPTGYCVYKGTLANEKILGKLIPQKDYCRLPIGLRIQINNLS